MRQFSCIVLAFLLTLSSLVSAWNHPIFSKRTSALDSKLLHGRSRETRTNNFTSVSYGGDENDGYFCNITLGGTNFTVIIDTGSSDLWVKGEVAANFTAPQTTKVNLTYAKGMAAGYISQADLLFDGYSIPNQAYINVTDTDENFTPNIDGLIGLGPSFSSLIRLTVNSSAVNPPLDRIFRQDMTTPNYITLLVPRASPMNDTGLYVEDEFGALTVGEMIPGYEEISKMPKLPALLDQDGNTHWQTLLDEDGIIGPDGDRIPTKTAVENPEKGSENQLHVFFDSGYSLPQLPKYIVDEIYGRVPGAQLYSSSNISALGLDSGNTSDMWLWRVPCSFEFNISFIFSGVAYPVTSLDITERADELDLKGNEICYGTFQQTGNDFSGRHGAGAADGVLGMRFLRNAYLLINFGDFVDQSNSSVADPYIQLLSTVDQAKAHQDFVTSRLEGKDTTASQPPFLASDSHALKSNAAMSDNDHGRGKGHEPLYKKTWFIVVLCVVGAIIFGVLACFLTSWIQLRRRTESFRRTATAPASEDTLAPQFAANNPLLGGSGGGRYADDTSVYEAEKYGDVESEHTGLIQQQR